VVGERVSADIQQRIADGKGSGNWNTISVKDHERERHFDPITLYGNRFWNRRSDGIVIVKNRRTLYILEVKRSLDRNEDFLGLQEDKANT